MRWPSLLPLAACALLLSVRAASVEAPLRSSSIAAADERIVVANEDSGTITLIDARTRTKRAEIAVCSSPRSVSIDGNRAFVACADGRVARVALDQARLEAKAEGGLEPAGLIAHGSRVYVADHGAAEVRVLDAETLAAVASIATEDFPRGLALDPAAKRLYVTHFRSGRVSVIDTAGLRVTSVMSAGAEANLSQSIVLARGRAYLPQTRSNVSNRALLFDNTVFPVVNVLDLATGAPLNRERIALDVVDQPVNMPFDAVVTSAGKLYVVHAGSDDLSAIKLDFQETVAHLDLGFHPRGIALSPDERFVYVDNALSGTVSVIDTAADAVVATIAATTIPLDPILLRGKILFHSSSTTNVAKDEWISCATCHFEGGADGRTWFFRDGIRNTPALFGVATTLPMHWSGDLDELQDVESTIRTVQAGSGLAKGDGNCTPACDQAPPNAHRSQELDDLAAFMRSLRPPRRRIVTTEAAQSGEALFAIHCASCHPAPLYTDLRKHDVGTGSAVERKGTAFDTPSLRGVFDSAPYLHDGSAATLGEAIRRHTNAPDVDDIAAFVQTIPFPGQKRRALRSAAAP